MTVKAHLLRLSTDGISNNINGVGQDAITTFKIVFTDEDHDPEYRGLCIDGWCTLWSNFNDANKQVPCFTGVLLAN